MPFIAHAAIMLANDENPGEKEKWHFIKKYEGIDYYWKYDNNR